MPLKLTTYYKGADIPDNLPGNNTFHSKELFLSYEDTPGYTPIYIVASLNETPVAKLLACIRTNKHWLPPMFIRQCVIYGTGDIFCPAEVNKEEVFAEMLEHLTKLMKPRVFVTEFRNLENALFCYKYFKRNEYIPINWLRVRNNLSELKEVSEDFYASRQREIKKGLRNGASISEARSLDEVRAFAAMLKKVYASKIRRYIPDITFFLEICNRMMLQGKAKIFVVKYEKKIIGGSVCLYSDKEAYLWFSGGMTKLYSAQYPGVLAVWAALEDAQKQQMNHLEFMDPGLPFKKYGYRNFILRFGGYQLSTRRWFRISWGWLNKLFLKIYV